MFTAALVTIATTQVSKNRWPGKEIIDKMELLNTMEYELNVIKEEIGTER